MRTICAAQDSTQSSNSTSGEADCVAEPLTPDSLNPDWLLTGITNSAPALYTLWMACLSWAMTCATTSARLGFCSMLLNHCGDDMPMHACSGERLKEHLQPTLHRGPPFWIIASSFTHTALAVVLNAGNSILSNSQLGGASNRLTSLISTSQIEDVKSGMKTVGDYYSTLLA